MAASEGFPGDGGSGGRQVRPKRGQFTAGVFTWCERNEDLWALELRLSPGRSQDGLIGAGLQRIMVRACAGNKGGGDERLA